MKSRAQNWEAKKKWSEDGGEVSCDPGVRQEKRVNSVGVEDTERERERESFCGEKKKQNEESFGDDHHRHLL